MTFPPPSPERPSIPSQGGFGPPPDFGTQPPAASDGQRTAGVFGPPPAPFVPGPAASQPGPDGGDGTPRVAALFIGAVLVVGLGVAGLLVAGGDRSATADAARRAAPSASPEPATPSASPDGDAAGNASPGPGGGAGGASPGASGAPSAGLPFVALDDGVCFDHPELDPAVREVVERPCTQPHDGEVIGSRRLTGDFSSDRELRKEALRLCGEDVRQRMRDIPEDGRQYYNYALYPSLPTYERQGEDRVSCALTLSDGPGGRKLTSALP